MIDIEPIGDAPWMDDALCAQSFYGDLHFPEGDGAGIPPSRRQIDAAIAMCGGCPVRQQCRQLADRLGVEDGIWGGVNYAKVPGAGSGPANAAKESCNRGHGFTTENTGRDARGHRRCRTCDREDTRKRRAA